MSNDRHEARVPRAQAWRRRAGILVVLLLVSSPAFGVGEVVTDPGAYSHMVSQIKAANEMINEARKQVETLGGIKTVMQDVKYSTEGIYGRGVGILDAVQDVARNAEDFGSSVKKAQDFRDFNKENWNKHASPYREVNVRLDGVWKDPRSRDYSFWKDKDKRYNAQQQIYKDNLASAEYLQEEKLPKHLKRLSDLAGVIDQTKNLKDAADLQNRFLAEILLIQQESLKMLTHIAQAMAAQSYQGVQPEEAKKAVDSANNPVPPRDFVRERAASMGVVGISDEERKLKLNEAWNQGANQK